VPGLELDLDDAPPTVIGHGTYDPVIPVEWGRQAAASLEDAVYRESPLPHMIDPRFASELAGWVADLPTPAPRP
jgi:predicted esterase